MIMVAKVCPGIDYRPGAPCDWRPRPCPRAGRARYWPAQIRRTARLDISVRNLNIAPSMAGPPGLQAGHLLVGQGAEGVFKPVGKFDG